MDAADGDKIELKVNYLKNVKMAIAIGPEFKKSENLGEYLFTENVNEDGGFLRFPYPYQSFFTLTYSPSKIPAAQPDGQWNYEIKYIRNPYAGKIEEAMVGNQTI